VSTEKKHKRVKMPAEFERLWDAFKEVHPMYTLENHRYIFAAGFAAGVGSIRPEKK